MICENCGKAQAKIHMTEIINENEKREHHLCEKCAEKLGYAIKQHFSLSEVLAGLGAAQLAARQAHVPDVKCPSCGLTFAEFQVAGRFGCAEDYEAFGELIQQRLERFHDATQHIGKVPRYGDRASRRGARLRALRSQLREAIEKEDYERAAKLRDEIKSIESMNFETSQSDSDGGKTLDAR